MAAFAGLACVGMAAFAQAQDTDTMRGDPSTNERSMTEPRGTTGTEAGSPARADSSVQDPNRAAPQPMAPDADAVRSRIEDPDSDLRNDRTTMARAPRADRN